MSKPESYTSKPLRTPSGLPVFSDACRYISEKGFMVVDYFIIGGVIESPKDYRGLVITGIENEDKVIIHTSIGDLIIDHDREFLVNKEGFRSKLIILKDEKTNSFIIVADPEKPIENIQELEELKEYLEKTCYGE